MLSMKISKEKPTSVPTFTLHEEETKLTAPSFRMLNTEKDLYPDSHGDLSSVASNLSQKFEEFAVQGLVEEYETQTDVIAHLGVLKKLFATAYSEAGVSLAVQCFGDTLVLSPGPEEGDKTVEDESLFRNFARLSVESCGCFPGPHELTEGQSSGEPLIKPGVFRCNFESFRLLVANELLLVSNGNVLTSLHLWDLTETVTPLTWMDAWLGNVIASVPEVAVCYHEKGTVQGYNFLKTSEIPSAKGTSPDAGRIVLHNALVVLKFLQSHCNQNHGAYWLYRRTGDDELQLFDLSKSDDDNGTTLMKEHPGVESFIHQTLTLRKSRVYQAFGDKHLKSEELDQAERR